MPIVTNWNAPYPQNLFPGEFVIVQLIEPFLSNGCAKPFRARIHTPEGCGQVLTSSNMDCYPSPPHAHTICTDCVFSWASDWMIWRPRPGVDDHIGD